MNIQEIREELELENTAAKWTHSSWTTPEDH